MRVLLTGASGQLGSYLLRHLQGSAHAITAASGSQSGELFGCPLHSVDLSRAEAARATLASRSKHIVCGRMNRLGAAGAGTTAEFELSR